MNYMDIIGIGAINYDYIFFCKKPAEKKNKLPESGQELLNANRKSICEDIEKLRYTTDHTNQICGSAYFALKAVNAISPDLKLSYVGVCGKLSPEENKFGFTPDISKEFSFLSNKDWLFFDDGAPGIALVRVVKGTRDCIDIDPGVNSKLKSFINDKEKMNGKDSFIQYLSRSKWIHLSSLSDFNQFLFIVEKVKEAKKMNPLLKVSVDPGYEYTKNYKVELRDVFSIADYVFLNNNEFDNLIGDRSLSEKRKFEVLAEAFNNCHLSNSQVIVIKNKSKQTLISFDNGEIMVSNYRNKRLFSRRIKNDTGAGDAFAGGFMASMLSPHFLINQPGSIRVGAVTAIARMKCADEPFESIAKDTRIFFDKIRKDESSDFRQKIKLIKESIKNQISTFVVGLITGIIASLFVWMIQLLFK